MNSFECPTRDIEMQRRSKASRRRQRQRVVRAKMQFQANDLMCQHKAVDIAGTAGGLAVAVDVKAFDEASLELLIEFMPTKMAESRKEDNAMIQFSNEAFCLMVRFGNPMEFSESTKGACEVMNMLQIEDSGERRQLAAWLAIYARQLALSSQGCRVLQKAIEVVNSTDLNVLIKQLEPHVWELAQSPHGNFVLAKMIERMPPVSVTFVIDQLQGNASKIAQNKFGCRVLERLIEHCSEQQLADLVGELIADADVLSRHQFGNFVVQHLVEHGATPWRSSIVQRLLPCISALAMHRYASHVVQKAFNFSNDSMQAEIVEVFLQAECPNSLVDVACSRYGSYVVSQLARIPCTASRVRAHVWCKISFVQESHYGMRTIESLRLMPHALQVQN